MQDPQKMSEINAIVEMNVSSHTEDNITFIGVVPLLNNDVKFPALLAG
ncbi:hypothetical protein [Xenorhabdus santafensis]|nr:hypothetical protein [Xenorhabdus sp. 12]